MAFVKLGESLEFATDTNIMSAKEALADKDIALNFIKMAKKLKQIAPKADDFLYGHAIMMHAAEAALIDQNTGEIITNKSGEPVKGHFEAIKVNGKDSVKWVSPDDIMPYKNANGDIFSEAELVKAHKMWVGKPLCKDHKSESVDGIRGIVIDTYYDPKFKRVHALFALDKKNYADLARKVETGYANCVSMGTAVGRSVCTECGNVARTERDYCHHIKARSNYGEINLDLSPIELSLVVNGADGKAKIRNIVASINQYVDKKQARIAEMMNDRCVNPTELQSLAENVAQIQSQLNGLLKEAGGLGEEVAADKQLSALEAQLENATAGEAQDLLARINKLRVSMGLPQKESKQEETSVFPRATGGGGEGYAMQHTDPGSGKVGWPPFSPERRLASEGDNQGALSKELGLLRSKVNAMTKAFNKLTQTISKEENYMNSARLRARAKARRAYWLGGGGVNEPTPGKEKYPKEEADKIRDTEDKQMVGEPLETGSEGLHPGDKEVKEKWLRAEELKNRKLQRQALLEQTQGSDKLTDEQLKARSMKRRAYWLGGGGVNEPTPGKEKYPKEEADKIRDNEDKHLQGIYDMGGTDGMVPGDEQEKKKWLRASLKATFTKVADKEGKLSKEASKWSVFAGDKLLLTATAGEIFEDEIDAKLAHPEFATNWDYLSSKRYGKDLIRHIREDGLEHVAYLLKGAQPPADPAAAPAAPAEPAPEAAPAEMPGDAAPVDVAGEGGEVEVKQEKGETQEKVNAALSTMEERIAEIRDLVAGSESEELVDIDVNVSDKDEAGAEAAPAPEVAPEAPPMEGALAARRDDMLKVEALLNDSADELALISEALEGDQEMSDRVEKAVTQALEDSETVLSEAEAVLKEAKKGKVPPQFMKKDDDKEDKDDKEEKDDKKEDKKDKKKEAAKKDDKKDDDDKEEKDDKKDDDKEDKEEKKASKLLNDALRLRAENRAALLKAAMGGKEDLEEAMKDLESGDTAGAKHEVEEALEGMNADDEVAPEDCGCGPMHAEDCAAADDVDAADFAADLEVAESPAEVLASRKAEREEMLKQAGDILGKYELGLDKAQNATEKTYFDAHPGGKGTTTDLTHTKTDGAKVETISEVHDVMRDVAESGPRNVREAAAQIQEAIVKGALDASKIDQLVAEGKVDAAAAAYWKKYFGQAPDAGSFGADLSKEFASKKKEASVDELKAKMRRAYAIGLQAQEAGRCANTPEALNNYVDELMTLDSKAFDSFKRIIAIERKSGVLPRTTAESAKEPINVTASAEPVTQPSIYEQLDSLGWK